jgi:hypothetical protein
MVTYRFMYDVPIEKIAVESEDYCFDYVSNSPHVEAEGTFPPILFFEGGCFQPVFGREQIHRFRLGAGKLAYALQLEGLQPGLETVHFSIGLKRYLGGFSVVERSLALRRLRALSVIIDDEVRNILEVPNHESTMKKMIALADAPNELKELVHGGVLHENTVFEIFNFKREHWTQLAHFICSLSLGTKKRNEILSMISSIARRDGKSVLDILQKAEIQSILQKKNIDPPQRSERLYTYIRNLRYPSIREFGQRFDRKLKEVHMNSKFQLILPENFERWQFRLVVPFSSAEEFLNNVEELRRTGERKSFEDLMAMRF